MSQNDIEKLIVSYAENKSEMNKYKKVSDKQNAEIKAYMRENKLSEKDAGDYTVTFSVEPREKMDEDLLLEIVKGFDDLPEGVIKTAEYVDTDALESAVYNKLISKENILAIDKARVEKPVEVLRIKKARKKG